MAEMTIDLHGMPLAEAYDELVSQTRVVLEGIDDDIAAMATMSSLIQNAFGHLWTGFYRVVEADFLLRVGPYQGTLGCLEIPFGRGVCGAAASECRAIIVGDVQEFADHITCDARSRSEIVLPVTDASGSVVAVFDIDSESAGTFDADDERGLTKILSRFSRQRNSAGVMAEF